MQINSNSQKAYQLFHDGILALSRTEMQGFRVDVDYIKRKLEFLQRKMERCERKFKESDFYADWQKNTKGVVNINSGPQLGEYLYTVKKLTPAKYTKGGKTGENKKGSTDEEALKQLGIPELNSYYEEKTRIKKSTDVLSGFLSEQVDGVLHPFYNLHLARTFRSSNSDPNMQNVPIRDEEMMQICRKAIYPRIGHQLLEVDFGQLEVRISACYNKDEKLIYDILHGDMHTDMAAEIFMIDDICDKLNSKNPVTKTGHKLLRQAAKNGFVFAEFYGDYYKNTAENLACNWGKLPKIGKWKYGQGPIIDEIGKPFRPYYLSDHLIGKGIKEFGSVSKTERGWIASGFMKHIKDIEDNFWNVRYKIYKQWKEDWFEQYQKTGYIDSLTGFRFSGVMNKKETSNYPVQSAAFHCLLWSLVQFDKFIIENNLDSRIIGQIHDSLIIDVNPKELDLVGKTIHRITTNDLLKYWEWVIVPLEIDASICPVDGSWVEKTKYELV
jgi:DNA polymerase I-like protein with 3'-5' exonuclease and polymerase domains